MASDSEAAKSALGNAAVFLGPALFVAYFIFVAFYEIVGWHPLFAAIPPILFILLIGALLIYSFVCRVIYLGLYTTGLVYFTFKVTLANCDLIWALFFSAVALAVGIYLAIICNKAVRDFW